MKKFLFTLAILVILIYVGFHFEGHVVLARAFEKSIGAPVEVGRVLFNPFASEVGIYDFAVLNPPGFEKKMLASVPEIKIHYDVHGLLKHRVHLWQIVLNLDEVQVEKNQAGQINLLEIGAIKEKVSHLGGAQPASRKNPQAESGQKPKAAAEVKIDEARISIGRARYVETGVAKPVVKEFSLNVQNETLHHVTEPRRIVQDIVFITLRKVGMSQLTSNLDILGKDLGAEARTRTQELKGNLSGLVSRFKVGVGESTTPVVK